MKKKKNLIIPISMFLVILLFGGILLLNYFNNKKNIVLENKEVENSSLINFEESYIMTLESLLNNNIKFEENIETLELETKEIETNVESKAVAEVEVKVEPFYPLTDYEYELVTNIVCGEAGNQPYWGKVAVASCILNACLFENKRPEDIQKMYGYAGWKSIEEFEAECLKAYENTILADEVREAVEQVFNRGEVYSDNVYWFYNPSAGYSSFHESMNYIDTIGNHKFFGRW